jgi:hypothetical protein
LQEQSEHQITLEKWIIVSSIDLFG